MRVLGIDPGYDRLGVAVLERNGSKEHILFSDCLITNRKESHAKRLSFIGVEIKKIIETWQPEYVAIEKLFFNQNITNGIKVAEVRGVVIYESHLAECIICEYGPQEIKVAVTGYGRSDKASIIAMVKRITGISKPKVLDDEYDAIAIGITCLAHEGSVKKSLST
ncbi:MAG: crossover junction endodeoxyribonuclease RuvC [Candidatus Zambryskibacteria bacterium CG10_big_fil_rev_8_21_14_0_10_42_12]|uniref:Crossover junction endodeoxyribonuclease RuvC n=1 Tax=Candidatus Zambryskibacteria bacterium CG10_big_fil_rev_8_21_14_0_10_42_12 TaxID=1975115 RepID=A0A2H0QSH0_9BACT|nr:MAG: crossover junction endodeoxyribonuclease RuvC [Candidatus Zambryskibacteria bacterium CG10_big_fil_rev_8_21_14_0_10_42_12]